MRLDDLLAGIDALEMVNVFGDTEVAKVTCDSREVSPGCVFVAVSGTKLDGHEFIAQALDKGATAVIHSRAIEPDKVGSYIRVRESRAVYAELCARLAGHPSKQLRVIGVTGTNGKTSTALITYHLLREAGRRPAVLGTLGLRGPDDDGFTQRGLTTPDPAVLQRIMRELVGQGATHLVMEVSSHALVQNRVDGVEFAGAVFTNLSQDHYDYHGSSRAYREAKALLFTKHLAATGGYAVINSDDETGRLYSSLFHGIKVLYGSGTDCNLVMRNLRAGADGLAWELVVKNGVWPPQLRRGVNQVEFSSPLAGAYNAYNCMAAAGVCLLEGLSMQQVTAGISSFPGVPGRLQRVDNPAGRNAFVDYAHTPDAVENVLQALIGMKSGNSRIITVIGCGGDRDRDKRPKMGRIAQQYSDVVVVTSDNPRSEDPDAIIDEIFVGIEPDTGEIYREKERRKAIALAMSLATPADLVLVAGKGHEDYQVVGDEVLHFSDTEEIQSVRPLTADK